LMQRRWIARACLVVAGYALVLLTLRAVAGHVTFPEEELGMAPGAGGVGVVAHQLLGRGGGTDFLIEYGSAYALTHGANAYDNGANLFKLFGENWPVYNANPHPPTIMTLVLPFTSIHYRWALAAWVLAMILALVATIRLVGTGWGIAALAGLGLAVTMPGAYAIGNVVPLIGLGAALAYRFRDEPLLAGLGIAIAAAPKISGLVLLIPFVLAGRIRAVVWGLAILALLAAVPAMLSGAVWSQYLDAGVRGIAVNAARSDNASWIRLAQRSGISTFVPLAVIGVVAILMALHTRDTFWPMVWVMVASLPIAWLYSLITLIPIGVWVLRRSRRWPAGLVVAAAALTLGTPPGGTHWPVVIFPVVTVLVAAAVLGAPRVVPAEFWISKRVRLPARLRVDAVAGAA
jgi:hypothetical protein